MSPGLHHRSQIRTLTQTKTKEKNQRKATKGRENRNVKIQGFNVMLALGVIGGRALHVWNALRVRRLFFFFTFYFLSAKCTWPLFVCLWLSSQGFLCGLVLVMLDRLWMGKVKLGLLGDMSTTKVCEKEKKKTRPNFHIPFGPWRVQFSD